MHGLKGAKHCFLECGNGLPLQYSCRITHLFVVGTMLCLASFHVFASRWTTLPPPYSLLGSEISFVEFMDPKEGVPFVSWAPKASDGESFIRSKIKNYIWRTLILLSCRMSNRHAAAYVLSLWLCGAVTCPPRANKGNHHAYWTLLSHLTVALFLVATNSTTGCVFQVDRSASFKSHGPRIYHECVLWGKWGRWNGA